MYGSELKSAIKAANITLEELAHETGIHASTLSRAQSGLVLSIDQQARITTALRAALKRAERQAARTHEKLSRRVASETLPAA